VQRNHICSGGRMTRNATTISWVRPTATSFQPRHASVSRILFLVLIFTLGGIQSTAVFAQSSVSYFCKNFRIIHLSRPEQPPTQLVGMMLTFLLGRGTYIQEFEGGGKRSSSIPSRIQDVTNNGQIILYDDSMGGQRIEEKFDRTSLTYSSTEYSLSGNIRSQIIGKCVHVAGPPL
jgi:hypothetical protein